MTRSRLRLRKTAALPGTGVAAALLAALLLAGAPHLLDAATTKPSASAQPSKDPFGDLVNRQRDLAKEAEAEEDPLRAIAHWEYVAAVMPNDAAAKAKIPALKKLAQDRAAQYFKDGFAQYEKQNIGPAFKALLKGLSYDPGNKEALRLVKLELNAKSIIDYKVEAGDTLASVAEKNKREGYDDPSLALVIARYNGLREGARLSAGQVLQVPVLVGVLPRAAAPAVAARRGTRPPEPAEEVSELDETKTNAQAEQAQQLLKQNKFDDAAKLAGRVLEEDPLNKGAREVRNAANMGLGQQLLDAKKFQAALTVFGRVDASYPRQQESVASARSQIQDNVELTYQEGVRLFLIDDLEGAIKAFEATLKANPNHPQAGKDLEVARDTRDKLKNLK
jgi:tetratricopeptide (TPR) repeat protein